MKTKINEDILKEQEACSDGIDWFNEYFKDKTVTIEEVIAKMREVKIEDNYMEWLFKKYELDGLCEEWHRNGQMWCRENYKDGKKDGLCEEWYDNGKMWRRYNYKNGKADGLCEGWYKDGQVWYRDNYKDGKLI